MAAPDLQATVTTMTPLRCYKNILFQKLPFTRSMGMQSYSRTKKYCVTPLCGEHITWRSAPFSDNYSSGECGVPCFF